MLFSRDWLEGVTSGGGKASGNAVVPCDWPGFGGHFPGAPVVPAWILLGLVVALAEDAAGEALELRGIDRAKLLRPLGPGDEVSCEVEIASYEDAVEARARLFAAVGAVGSVALRLGRPAWKGSAEILA